ncbi:hypothetical protein [Nevskia ramosa]|uniref:hypothetical protein n=1 Tax=Nevskia ramosa TaxID=64002 RepID=UPI0003B41D76|nr:hypothetical protein [Nevskia ramosa]
MAINKRYPHVYDAEYAVMNGVREVNLFRRSAATSVNYTDVSGSVSRQKGFEDTNLTEDGRVNETGIVLQTIGIRIVPTSIPANLLQPGQTPLDELDNYDTRLFYERGYAELVLNDNQVVFTARIRDLVPASNIVASGALIGLDPIGANAVRTQYSESGSVTINNVGRAYPANGIRIPRGVRFALNLRWDRPLSILSMPQVARIEAELWGVSDGDGLTDAERASMPGGLVVPSPALSIATGLPAVR